MRYHFRVKPHLSSAVGPRRYHADVRARVLAVAPVLSCVLVYLFLSFLTFNQIEEDAFIYFRCAENISDGYGYVFNRGGDPVEAGSSLVWIFLLVLLHRLPFDLVISAKVAGIFIGVLSLVSVHRLGRRFIPDARWQVLPVLLTSTCVPFVMWSQRGLETSLYTLILLWLLIVCVERDKFRYWVIPAILLFLARPEGFFILLGLIPFFILHRAKKRELLASIAVFSCLVLLILLARFLYFHDFVPSPFYTKFDAHDPGANRVVAYFRRTHTYLLLIPILLAGWKKSQWSGAKLILVSFMVLLCLWSIRVADYLPYYRHLAPALPLFYIFSVSAFRDVRGFARPAVRVPAYGCVVAFAILGPLYSQTVFYFRFGAESPIRPALAAFLGDPGRFAHGWIEKVSAPLAPSYLDEVGPADAKLGVNPQALTGRFLRDNYREGATIVYDQMGQTPYYAGPEISFIDSLGLVSPRLAHYYFRSRVREKPLLKIYGALHRGLVQYFFPGERFLASKAEALDSIFGAGPDVILFHEVVAKKLPRGLTNGIARDPRLDRFYRKRYRLNRVVLVYERRGIRVRPPSLPETLPITVY